MARYSGPRCKICRREGEKLFLKGHAACRPSARLRSAVIRPVSMVGAEYRRSRLSDYSLQLREKQKMRRIYGVLERQFRLLRRGGELPRADRYEPAQHSERRLDNVVYRLGFADSRAQARQLVQHGHFNVNGRRTNIPSFIVTPGDVIEVRHRATAAVLQEPAGNP